MSVHYLPAGERNFDLQYRQLLELIMKKGRDNKATQGGISRGIIGAQLRFDLRNGFPLITERNIGIKQAKGEIECFLNGGHTLEELEKHGCKYWNAWVTAEKCEKRGLPAGDLGPGSYGAAWKNFPTENGGSFDQIRHVLEQMKELPHLKTHIVVPWIPHYLVRGKGKQQRVVVVPCHGYMHFFADDGGGLSLSHIQRSGDVPVGVPYNFVHYALILMAFAEFLGREARELIYYIEDAHIYDMQFDYVRELLTRPPRIFPRVTFSPKLSEDFEISFGTILVEEYDPHPAMRIPTPV